MDFVSFLLAAVAITGTTTRPDHNCYVRGEKAEVRFSVTGLAAGADETVRVAVFDAFGERLDAASLKARADAKGAWSGCWTLPSDRYGAFRVTATVAGAELPRCGTRGAGYLTYAVLPDPAKRPYLPPEDAFLGLHGSADGQTPWLGARWRLGKWPSGDDAQFAEFMTKRRVESWTNHFIITASRIFQRPGCFTKEGWDWVKAHCPNPSAYATYWTLAQSEEGRRHLADAYRTLAHRVCHEEDFGQRMHVYEAFWEPELHYPDQGTMLRAAKLVWEAIRSEDPHALVAMPTFHRINSLEEHRDVFEKGLAEHMNALCVHPYGMPNEGQTLRIIRDLRKLVREHKGTDVPFFSTEANVGAGTDAADERRQLDLVVRSLLVLKGEGFAFHHVFYGYDYGGDRADVPNGGCGLAYNLEYPKNRWDARVMSPKPAFAGVSAFSWLVDGAKSVATLDHFGDSRLGYVYADRAGVCTMALWDWGGSASEVEIETGRAETRQADVMGNERRVATPSGRIKLHLTSTPVYLVDVDPSLWGREGRLTRQLAAARPAARAAALSVDEIRPTLANGEPAARVTLANDGDVAVKGTLSTRVRGVPEARVSRPVEVGAGKRETYTVAFPGWQPDPCVRLPVEIAFDGGKTRVFRRGSLGYFGVPRDRSGAPVAWAGGTVSCSWNERGLTFDVVAPAPCLSLGFAKMALEKRTDNGFADLVRQSHATFAFARNPDGTASARRTTTFHSSRFPLGPVPAQVSITSEGKAWRHRFTLAWADLNVTDPKVGDAMRFAFSSGSVQLFGFDAGLRQYGELVLE